MLCFPEHFLKIIFFKREDNKLQIQIQTQPGGEACQKIQNNFTLHKGR